MDSKQKKEKNQTKKKCLNYTFILWFNMNSVTLILPDKVLFDLPYRGCGHEIYLKIVAVVVSKIVFPTKFSNVYFCGKVLKF